MLTLKPTLEMVTAWKKIYEDNREHLKPNRKSGVEIDDYFRKKYMPHSFDSVEFKNVVIDNMMLNEVFKEKLPQGQLPNIMCYCIDDLFVFRGLDAKDLTNYFLVAQYIQCLER